MTSPTRGFSRRDSDGPSHPVYSDFSYLGSNVGNLVFAVGLREDSHAAEEVINRILPLKKTLPKPIQERKKIVNSKSKIIVDETCSRADCALKRERLQEIQGENEHLRAQLKSIENRVLASKNKLSIMEKTIAITEEKNEGVQGMIDETQARISSLEVEVSRGEINNESLRAKLSVLHREIDVLKEQTEEHTTVMQNMNHKAIQKVVFGNKKREELDGEDAEMARSVARLEIDIGIGRNMKGVNQGSSYEDSDDEKM
mmetsp:Transcript_24935/g.25154  ORF Transcript_24935/g.25154 Transcript_24935/m.25154 type:complete len:257 (-) Transcript_24935:126-896(-)|eukprot:CAMPEP_0182426544 /NCGR_PEP_ID=MMETSP1167-20130531/13033_1 /TAXON_ID=2988 /ORGANISM="Mallomonas Sp, Strain CCMP3275" /LENGTH=256 /DNA_ID=CAMNT_0024608035 /DNA_START=305 /DNA_END=1075 /DNA_ORIENTATION=-